MYSLTKRQRLKTPADYQRVYKSKQWGSSKHFTFNVLPHHSLELFDDSPEPFKNSPEPFKNSPEQMKESPGRPENNAERLNESPEVSVLGVTVSKKVSKRAVDRNRIKRQVKEFYRARQNELLAAQVVITARPSCLKASDEQRLDSLDELWVKLMKWQRWHSHQQKNHSHQQNKVQVDN